MIPQVSRPFFLFESRLSRKPARLYHSPSESCVAFSPSELIACLQAVESWQSLGDHAVVLLSYEAASAFGLPVCLPGNDKALARCYRFSSCELLDSESVDEWLEAHRKSDLASCSVDSLALRCNEDTYTDAFNEVKAAIERGDTYQVNLTSAYEWSYEGCEIAWYQLLRAHQPVDYSALLALEEETILSLSPELFYRKENNRIETKPMKGTSKRDLLDSSHDDRLAFDLQKQDKTVAENVMIVDLMRNDLNRVSHSGTVSVSDLCAVERYPSVHQMVSTVSASVDENVSLISILQALFPSGSITGAPKYSTMACVQRLEKEARGIYTGAIGFVTPDNDQCFNIPIRTLCLKSGRGHLGVGGGLVHQSESRAEFQEMLLKARFFKDALRGSDVPVFMPESSSFAGIERKDSLKQRVGESLKGSGVHVAMIDHRDSFTYTLVDYCKQLGATVTVFSLGALPDRVELNALGVTHMIFSPGPGHPNDYPDSLALLQEIQDCYPVLGVCLGHQLMGLLAGARVVQAPIVMHGRTSELSHSKTGLHTDVPSPVSVMRYHSLAVEADKLSTEWVIDAVSDDQVIMAMHHQTKLLFGVQYHPESVLTDSGLALLEAFFKQ